MICNLSPAELVEEAGHRSVGMRVMTAFAAAAPSVSKRFVPKSAKQVAVDLAEGQRNKR